MTELWQEYKRLIREAWVGSQWPFGKLLIFPAYFALWTTFGGLAVLCFDLPIAIKAWFVSSGTWERYFWKSPEAPTE